MLGVLLLTCARDARADWLITPFLGTTFSGSTTFVIPEIPNGATTRQTIFGGSGAWLTDLGFGVETDFAYAPHYFEADDPRGTVIGSNLVTWTFNGILAVPLSVTRESLRPYVVGGLGLIHAHSEDRSDLYPVDANMLGLNVGGGAIGFLTNRTGLRFEIRHFRTIGTAETLSGLHQARLAYWRVTVGVTLRR